MPVELGGATYLDVHEVAARLGLSERQVRRRLRQGDLQGVKAAAGWLVPEEVIDGRPEGDVVRTVAGRSAPEGVKEAWGRAAAESW